MDASQRQTAGNPHSGCTCRVGSGDGSSGSVVAWVSRMAEGTTIALRLNQDEERLAVPRPTEPSLHELRAGSRSARADLFSSHVADIERVLVSVMGPDHELRDLLQEVFLVAFKSIKDYRGDERGLRFWLAQIAVNLARMCIRRRKRRRLFLHRALAEPVHYEEVVEDRTLAEALRRTRLVLERMPADERIPLSLATLQGRSLKETAELCGVSLATVKRRLQKGRKRFLRLAAHDPILREFCSEVET